MENSNSLLTLNLSRLDLHNEILCQLFKSFVLYMQLPYRENAERSLALATSRGRYKAISIRQHALSKEVISQGGDRETIESSVRESKGRGLDMFGLLILEDEPKKTWCYPGTEKYNKLRVDIDEAAEVYSALMKELKAIEDTPPEKPAVSLDYMSEKNEKRIMAKFLDYLEENDL